MRFQKIIWALSLLLPSFSTFSFEDQSRYYADLGTWFGGDLVANNPAGDNYRAGSGAVLDFGYSWLIPSMQGVYARGSLGYRYQGALQGNGSNSGIVFEASIAKNLSIINLGVGIHADIANITKDELGRKTEFDDVLGALFYIESGVSDNASLTVKYHMLDYTSKTGTKFAGSQLGLFVTVFF